MPKADLMELVRCRCLRCGHDWIPQKAEVRICPKCKSGAWDVPKGEDNALLPDGEVRTCKCIRCSYEWRSRKVNVRHCANRFCHTVWWDREPPRGHRTLSKGSGGRGKDIWPRKKQKKKRKKVASDRGKRK